MTKMQGLTIALIAFIAIITFTVMGNKKESKKIAKFESICKVQKGTMQAGICNAADGKKYRLVSNGTWSWKVRPV